MHHNSRDDEPAGRGSVPCPSRRRALTALGVAASAAVAGCSGAGDATTTDSGGTDTTTTPTGATTTTRQRGIDPRFGYTATDPGETPPVEPDHTVDLVIRPVDRRPIPEFFFEPTGLFVEPGDTVKFNLATPHHNVNAYHPAFTFERRVPEGVPPFSSPVLGARDYWLYTFREEGVYDLVCAPHEYFGMAGRIVAGSATGPGANPVGEAPGGDRARPPEFTAALVLSDGAVAPENVVSQGSVSWDDLAPESKRLLLRPVEGGGD